MTALLDHQALPFDHTDQLVETVVAAAVESLQHGRPVLTVFPGELAELIGARLGSNAADVDVLPYEECYDVAPRTLARFVDTVHGYAADGLRPTLMGGSLLVRREPDDVLPWLQMEAVLNDALADVAARLVCCYPRTGQWTDVAALSTHPTVLVDGSPTLNEGYLSAPTFLAAHPEPAPPHLGEPTAAIRFGLPELRATRRLVTEHASRTGISDARRGELARAVSEAVSNTIEHGPGTGTLRVWTTNTSIICEVHDTGYFQQPHLGLLPPPPTDPRGRGLWLIRQLPDRTHLWRDDTGTTIRMTIHS